MVTDPVTGADSRPSTVTSLLYVGRPPVERFTAIREGPANNDKVMDCIFSCGVSKIVAPGMIYIPNTNNARTEIAKLKIRMAVCINQFCGCEWSNLRMEVTPGWVSYV